MKIRRTDELYELIEKAIDENLKPEYRKNQKLNLELWVENYIQQEDLILHQRH